MKPANPPNSCRTIRACPGDKWVLTGLIETVSATPIDLKACFTSALDQLDACLQAEDASLRDVVRLVVYAGGQHEKDELRTLVAKAWNTPVTPAVSIVSGCADPDTIGLEATALTRSHGGLHPLPQI